MRKVLCYFILAISIFVSGLVLGTYDVAVTAVKTVAGLAVAQSTGLWNNVKDAAYGDNATNGVMVVSPYLYDGTNFDAARGDTTNGIDVDVTRIQGTSTMAGANTPADNTTTPTNAINSIGFNMVYDGTKWDMWRGDSTNGATVNTEIPSVSTITDTYTNPSTSNIYALTGVWNGATWNRLQEYFYNTSCNAVITTGACTTIDMTKSPKAKHTFTTVVTGTPTSVNVDLEGSLDNTDWFVLDSSTTTTSEMRHVTGVVNYIRANVTTLTGGTSPTITVKILDVN